MNEERIGKIPNFLYAEQNSGLGTTVIVGKNGSGKTTLLSFLAKHYTDRGNTVFAISNTIFDKFNIRRKNFHYISLRHGRKLPENTIKQALMNLSAENTGRLKNISLGLKHIGYDSDIGLALNNFNFSMTENILSDDTIPEVEREDIIALLYKLHGGEYTSWFNMETFSFENINKSIYSRLIRYESLLKRHKIISSINIYLKKQEQPINLIEASSGELTFISTLIFLISRVTPNSIILVDEPENSLHPAWQHKYVEIILDALYLYEPQLVLATHSPMILTGAKNTYSNIKIVHSANNSFDELSIDSSNIEKIYMDLFDIVTPQNRQLSDTIVDLLNNFAAKKISFSKLKEKINALKDCSFDNTQKLILEKTLTMANTFSISRANNE